MSEQSCIPAYVEIKPGAFTATNDLSYSEALEITADRFFRAEEADREAKNLLKYFVGKFGEGFEQECTRVGIQAE